jgi:hypothetical protein
MKMKLLMILFSLLLYLPSFSAVPGLLQLSCTDANGGSANIAIAGEYIWIAYLDKNNTSGGANGYSNSEGGFSLNQGDLGCGSGANIKIDNGLLNGSVREGVAAISVLPNYGCGGGFATYDCKVR